MSHTPTSAELAPCPWCKGANLSTPAYSVQPDNFHSAYVECDDCEARGPNALTVDGWLSSRDEAISEAATAWNRRAAMQTAEPVLYEVFFDGGWKPASEQAYYSMSEKNRRLAALDRAPSTDPKFDEAEFDKMVERGTKVWGGEPENIADILRGRAPSTDSAADGVIDSEAAFKASADSVNRTWNTAYRAGQQDGAAAWISVDERMPDNDQTVIILFWPFDNHENAQIVGQANHVEGVFYADDGEEQHYPSHWMPLPDAPAAAMQPEGGKG